MTHIDWNLDAFRALRTDPLVVAKVTEQADRIAAAAGTGFVASSTKITGGRGRARAAVIAETQEARAAEAEHHVLLKAAGHG